MYLTEDVHRTLGQIEMAFKVKLESVPSRLAGIDSDDYFLRMKLAEKIIDEALKEINVDSIRECSQGNVGIDSSNSETNAEA